MDIVLEDSRARNVTVNTVCEIHQLENALLFL